MTKSRTGILFLRVAPAQVSRIGNVRRQIKRKALTVWIFRCSARLHEQPGRLQQRPGDIFGALSDRSGVFGRSSKGVANAATFRRPGA